LLLAASFTITAQAKQMHALLVGVSEYPSLSKDLQLKGPRNDVLRVRDVLLQRGFEQHNIKVLADGVSEAGLPTRNKILVELDRLAKTATKDDFVFIYFAGHGSQQPADRKTAEGRAEPDGLYEIFLPRDVGQWSGSIGKVENALIKTELRDAVDRILVKGAFVWGVFDACHAATLVRGAGSAVQYRQVNPKTLGIPQAILEASKNEASLSSSASKTPVIQSVQIGNVGGSAFFYASQTKEAAPEMVLPKDQADGEYYGLFSFTLMQALETGGAMTYRQMAQFILNRYGAMNETRVTPLFSGTSLDQPVFAQSTPTLQQWKIERGNTLTVQAGALSRLSEGTIMAVMADPLHKEDEAIGYLKLTQVSLTSSKANPIPFNGKPALSIKAITESSFARITQIPPQYSLSVSIDTSACPQNCRTLSVVNELKDAPTPVAGVAIKWTDNANSADVILKLQPDRIILLSPAMQGIDCERSGALCEQMATVMPDKKSPNYARELKKRLSESLHAISRSTNLLRIATSLNEPNLAPAKLELTLKVVKKDGTQQSIVQGQTPTLKAGDRINVQMRNNGLTAVDVTMLYADARYGINVLYPRQRGASNRLEARDSATLDIAIDDETSGIERILTIAVEAAKTQERADFSFLAQSPLAMTRNVKRDSLDPDVMAFMDAGYATHTTRGDKAAAPSSRTTMQVFTVNISKSD